LIYRPLSFLCHFKIRNITFSEHFVSCPCNHRSVVLQLADEVYAPYCTQFNWREHYIICLKARSVKSLTYTTISV
jgi:hypothetical protein